MGMRSSFERYRRVDRGFARLEGALAVVILIGMVLIASAQALFFNFAEADFAWAQSALGALSWADTFLQKGTLCLTFLGASMATQQGKHIAIDVLPKLASPRTGRRLKVFASLGAGLTAFVLARVYYDACLVADAAVPFQYELLTPNGPAHVCDVATSELGSTARPAMLCTLRAALAAVGVPVSSGGGAAQLLVPLMLGVMGVRFLARALAAAFAPDADLESTVQPPPGSSGTTDA